MFIVYLVHQVYCIHCVTTAEKGTSVVFVSLQPRAPAWWSALLLQLREFTPVGGNCQVYLPDKGTRSIWAAKGGWVFYCKFYMYWCWNVNNAAKFKLQTSKYRSYWVGCMARPCDNTKFKSMLCFASRTAATSKVKEYEPYLWPHA